MKKRQIYERPAVQVIWLRQRMTLLVGSDGTGAEDYTTHPEEDW